MNHELYDVIDASGKAIGIASWEKVHTEGLLHRVVAVFIFKNDTKKELLLQRRSVQSEQDPGLWNHSAGGHVLHGEAPAESIKREIQEELFAGYACPRFQIREIVSFFHQDMENNHELLSLFEMVYNGPLYSGGEVEEIRWVRWETLLRDMQHFPYAHTQSFHHAIRQYQKARSTFSHET